MNWIKRAGVLVMCAVLLLATACGGDTGWAYQYDGDTMPAGLYIVYMTVAIAEMEGEVYETNADNPEYQYPGLKKQLQLLNPNGIPYTDWVKEEARTLAMQYFAAEKLFDERGLVLNATDQANIDYTLEISWSQYADVYEANGISRDSLRLYHVNEAKKDKIFLDRYYGDGEEAISEGDLKKMFQETYVKVDMLGMMRPFAEDDEYEPTPEEQAELQEALEKADSYVDMLKEGATFEQMVFEYQLSNASEESRDSLEFPKEGSRTYVMEVSQADDDDVIMESILAAGFDAPQVVDDGSFIYLINRHDLLEDPADFDSKFAELLSGLKADDYEAYLMEVASSLSVQVNQAAIDRYQPSKIKAEG